MHYLIFPHYAIRHPTVRRYARKEKLLMQAKSFPFYANHLSHTRRYARKNECRFAQTFSIFLGVTQRFGRQVPSSSSVRPTIILRRLEAGSDGTYQADPLLPKLVLYLQTASRETHFLTTARSTPLDSLDAFCYCNKFLLHTLYP